MEDGYLYPELQQSSNPKLAKMGKQYQQGMTHIVSAYSDFAAGGNDAGKVTRDPKVFAMKRTGY